MCSLMRVCQMRVCQMWTAHAGKVGLLRRLLHMLVLKAGSLVRAKHFSVFVLLVICFTFNVEDYFSNVLFLLKRAGR